MEEGRRREEERITFGVVLLWTRMRPPVSVCLLFPTFFLSFFGKDALRIKQFERSLGRYCAV